MEDIEILKEEIKSMIDKADEKTIRMTYAMLEAGEGENEDNADWWNSMPDEVKADVERAMKEADEGKLMPHEEAMKLIQKWLVK